MIIDQITDAGAMPALEASMSFAARRHRLIAHNVANLSTPRFEPKDVSVSDFRSMLADAVDDRRKRSGGTRGRLEMDGSREVRVDRGRYRDEISLDPRPSGRNIMFHDRNNRDLERIMQDLAENVAVFRVSGELWKNRDALLNAAIAERV